MRPVEFVGQNFQIAPPPDMENCDPLMLHVGEESGERVMTSCWELSVEEMHALQATGCVYLTVYGASHPPVRLSVQRPF